MRLLKRFCVGTIGGMCLSVASASAAQVTIGFDQGIEPPHLLADQPVEDYRLRLIDLAWQAATSYPINPHIKNRGRAEEQVVIGALGLAQPNLAWGYAKKMVNWRKGACYAELAHYLIAQGTIDHVEYFLRQALLHSKDSKQGWRHGRVKARVAAARLLMGNDANAEGLVEDQDFSGHGEAIRAKAADADEQAFVELVASLDQMVQLEGYDEVWAAMQGYAQLYRHHYPSLAKRTLLLKKIRLAWEYMPAIRRFEVMLQLADAALKNEGRDTAISHIDEADVIRQSFQWPIDYSLKLRSDVATYRVKVGQVEVARALLEDSATLAGEQLETLENFYRADALRPLAEAFADIGDKKRALQLYTRVVEVGALNPNMRPRISDITETCVSMALHGIKPDAELLRKIQRIVDGLSE